MKKRIIYAIKELTHSYYFGGIIGITVQKIFNFGWYIIPSCLITWFILEAIFYNDKKKAEWFKWPKK